MFVDMAAKYGISIHHRKVKESSLSFVMPKDGQRAIVRCRDDHYLHPFPPLNLRACRALHVDGHQADAAIHYAKACREAGILTSLDGGGLRSNTHELLEFIDVAVVAERLCEQMHMTSGEMLNYLRERGCEVGGVTLGERGLIWYEAGGEDRELPALNVPPELVIDTNGAGDIFHGAYVYLVSHQQGRKLGRPFPLRARGVGSFDPAAGQRGEPADARRHRPDPGALRRAARRAHPRWTSSASGRYSRFTGSFIATSLRRSLLMSRPSEK